MILKIDNRPHRHRRRNIAIGIISGILITIVGLYFFGDYEQPVSSLSNEMKANLNDIEKNAVVVLKNIKTNQNTFLQPTQPTYTLAQLQQVALDDINKIRQQNDVPPVTLDNAKASQVWAEHLLSESCITHREGNNGPMQRYVDNGDPMKWVFENVAATFGDATILPPDTIKALDDSMMNDDQMWSNLHRQNILNPNHVSVSIGIAYNSTNLVLVQDFQEPFTNSYYDTSQWKSFDMSYLQTCGLQ